MRRRTPSPPICLHLELAYQRHTITHKLCLSLYSPCRHSISLFMMGIEWLMRLIRNTFYYDPFSPAHSTQSSKGQICHLIIHSHIMEIKDWLQFQCCGSCLLWRVKTISRQGICKEYILCFEVCSKKNNDGKDRAWRTKLKERIPYKCRES